ncbi:MAG: acyl-homoserine-lactone synthase [Xanthobacteraceae bacterium]
MSTAKSVLATIFQSDDNQELTAALFRLRKALFIDERGWKLDGSSGTESDQFDSSDATYCSLTVNGRVVGGFRAIRCDRPYLGITLFPELATTRSYPLRSDYWEISRFGVLREYKNLGIGLYAVMFRFAERVNARALVAVTDLGHERLLGKIGVRTRRYGQPVMLRPDQSERPLQVVAGDIPISQQQSETVRFLQACANQIEIRDETLVQRPIRISA